tara:strand:+ start:8481 stop:9287 length:807 start_codon:yes stop_codon:yes gene_type:complete
MSLHKEHLMELSPSQWEWFALDVLFSLGFSEVSGPAEGPDDGRDLIVRRQSTNYLVSCKHYLPSGKNVGVRQELDIRDRIEQHKCEGFIPFYSTGPTEGLQSKFISLEDNGVTIFKIYQSNILDIIPTMRGDVLQKYFSRPQELHHHAVNYAGYKPLICMEPDCGNDILHKDNIAMSMVGFHIDRNNEINLIYGCKPCLEGLDNSPFWAEMTQIRYIEQMLLFRETIDVDIPAAHSGCVFSHDFYKYWALLQEGVLQIQIPQGWGQWI